MTLLDRCKRAYEDGNPIISDDDYDALGGEGGGCDPKINKVSLPFWMGSLNKARTQKELDSWKSKQGKGSFVLSSKIDGISGLYIDGKNLYSRGNGKTGSNLTKALEALKLPKVTYPVRGELVMVKHVFDEKYASTFKNVRNLVAGLFGRKNPDINMLKDISYIAYEIVDSIKSPSAQLMRLKEDGFQTPTWTIATDLYVKDLSTMLSTSKDDMDVDGIVIQVDVPYERCTSGNPSYVIAFKEELASSLVSSTVTNVEWNLSKWGMLKPVVVIEPVNVGGVTVTRLTGNNAKYIVDHGVAEGCIVLITRAGDVIPQIKQVVDPKPVILPNGSKWEGVNLVTTSSTVDDIIPIKTLVTIFSKLDVKLMGVANITRMFKGGLDTLPKILLSTSEQLEAIGFGPQQSKNILANIHTTFFQNGIQISEICGASGVLGYGIGCKRIELCFHEIPDFHQPQVNLKDKLMEIKGISTSITDKIALYHPMMIIFIEVLKKVGVILHHAERPNTTQQQTYVFSGFRDTELSKKFKVVDTISKDVILVVKDIDKLTSKLKKARVMGVKIISLAELKLI